MCTLDIIILLCFIPGLVRGLRKGFIEQAVALLSIVIGVFLAFHFSDTLTPYLAPYIKASEQAMKIISFAIIMVLVIIVLSLLGRFIAKVLDVVMLGWVDKLLGAVFAVLKVALILGVLILLIDSVAGEWEVLESDFFQNSVLFTKLRDAVNFIFPYFNKWIESFS